MLSPFSSNPCTCRREQGQVAVTEEPGPIAPPQPQTWDPPPPGGGQTQAAGMEHCRDLERRQNGAGRPGQRRPKVREQGQGWSLSKGKG